ncbi:MAG: replicative DNA helicase [Ruminococcus sp.]|nr:replicative DNA helicase [Ruminococcus sp.]
MENNNLAFQSKELPHSLEVEQAVIGFMLADSSLIPNVVEKVKSEYFYNENLRKIYNVICTMVANNKQVDVLTVIDETTKLHLFEDSAEAKRYFFQLGDILHSEGNVETYCNILADKYLIRSLGNVAMSILNEIYSGENNAQLLIDLAEQKIYDIRQGRDTSGLLPISVAVFEAFERLGKLSGEDREKYIGARTGFTLLDKITSGLNKSDLIIIAARPGMGKTSFVMNIARNVARTTEKEVAIFSLEMSKEQLATRMLSTEARVSSESFRNGGINTDEWGRIADCASYLSLLPIYIDETANVTVPQMKAKLRRLKNLGLVIIDYLQLMGSTSHSDNRVNVVSEITRQLKIMAKELNVPVILLSQLSRAVEGRNDKKPVLSDLRDSGSIEQDADIVLFLYRDAYYNTQSELQNVSECIVAKNRHGELGNVKLMWNGKYTLFSNPENGTPPE